jgi:acyl dehydratase
MPTFSTAQDVLDAVGSTLGSSDWFAIDQARIDTFADATEDRQWIHTDPARAAESPYGGTIAHGYLVLSLIPHLLRQIVALDGVKTALNYGLGQVRFIAPVKVGSRIRATSVLADAELREDGGVKVEYRTTIELQGSEKPACLATHIGLYRF